jgi:hypothetical protein
MFVSKNKNYSLQVYLGFLNLTAFFCLFFSLHKNSFDISEVLLGFWVLLFFFANMLSTKVFIKNFEMYLNVSSAISTASYFLFGLTPCLLVIIFGFSSFFLWKRWHFYKWAGTVSFWVISYSIDSFFISLIQTPFSYPWIIVKVIVFQAIFILLGTLLADLLISFGQKISLKTLLLSETKEVLSGNLMETFIYSMLACILMSLWLHTPWAVSLLFIPFYGLKLVMESGQKIQAELAKAMNALNDILEAKDEYTERHTDRVAKYAVIIAKHYGGFSDEQLDLIAKVGKIHDVGKVMVRDDVLKKPGKLTPEEYEHIKLHVQKDFVTNTIPPEYPLAKWLQLARLHHERYDGKGYPFGLKGEEIPIELRIISVADAWDAMTTRRVYRASLANDTALQTLKEGAGTQWDPTVINAFFKAYDSGQIQALQAEHKAKLQKQKWDALQKLDQYLSLESSL